MIEAIAAIFSMVVAVIAITVIYILLFFLVVFLFAFYAVVMGWPFILLAIVIYLVFCRK